MGPDTIHTSDGWTYYGWKTPRGVVYAVVRDRSALETEIRVYERNAAIACIGLEDDVAHDTPAALLARNRFGTRLILPILRWVRATRPPGTIWIHERMSGAAPGRRGNVGARHGR